MLYQKAMKEAIRVTTSLQELVRVETRKGRSSMNALAGTEGDRRLPKPSDLHPVRVYPL